MNTKHYNSKEELLERAKACINIPFKEIQNKSQLSNKKNKGSIGNMIQECWFGREPNSLPEPDFSEVCVELKVTPFIYNKNGNATAKERLVLNIINYMEDVVQNTNNIKEDNKMFNFGFFGPRKYDSRYMRKYYNPEKKKLECKYYDPTLDPCKDVVNKHNEFIRAFYSSSVKKEDFIENDSTVVLEATTYE